MKLHYTKTTTSIDRQSSSAALKQIAIPTRTYPRTTKATPPVRADIPLPETGSRASNVI